MISWSLAWVPPPSLIIIPTFIFPPLLRLFCFVLWQFFSNHHCRLNFHRRTSIASSQCPLSIFLFSTTNSLKRVEVGLCPSPSSPVFLASGSPQRSPVSLPSRTERVQCSQTLWQHYVGTLDAPILYQTSIKIYLFKTIITTSSFINQPKQA